MWRVLVLLPLAACATSGSSGVAPPARVAGLSCAPFARELTGVGLHGDAAAWWDEAGGRYARRHTPVVGSILVFRATDRLPFGHVSVVSAVLGPREIAVIQANWSPRALERDAPIVDVSAGGDWTLVRVWWSPIGAIGSHSYPTYGFIVPAAPLDHDRLAGGAEAAALRAGRDAEGG
jgi:hypothetical protein